MTRKTFQEVSNSGTSWELKHIVLAYFWCTFARLIGGCKWHKCSLPEAIQTKLHEYSYQVSHSELYVLEGNRTHIASNADGIFKYFVGLGLCFLYKLLYQPLHQCKYNVLVTIIKTHLNPKIAKVNKFHRQILQQKIFIKMTQYIISRWGCFTTSAHFLRSF